MTKHFFVTIVLQLGFLFSSGQQGISDLEYIKKVIKNSYLPLREKKDSARLLQYYQQYFNRTVPSDTFQFISKFLMGLNDEHLVLYRFRNDNESDSIACSKKYTDAVKYFANSKIKKDIYEGFWINRTFKCVVALKRDKGNSSYSAYVIESGENILKGLPLFKFHEKANDKYLTCYSFPYPNSIIFFLQTKILNKNKMRMSYYDTWEKLQDYKAGMMHFQKVDESAFFPSYAKISANTGVFTLPGMSGYYKRFVDSVLQVNDSIIKSTKNLIIDVRDNPGGTGSTYYSLLKYVYTNPIYKQSSYIFYSPDYIRYKEKQIEKKMKSNDTVNINKEISFLDSLKRNENRLIYDSSVIVKFDTVVTYPKKVAVLFNKGSVSAAELMLLDMEQSKKVTFFGENSGGVVDFLSTITIDFPLGNFHMTLPTERRTGIPNRFYRVDGKGIEPRIKGEIKDWIYYIDKYYHERNN